MAAPTPVRQPSKTISLPPETCPWEVMLVEDGDGTVRLRKLTSDQAYFKERDSWQEH